jgi:hypothetical protein
MTPVLSSQHTFRIMIQALENVFARKKIKEKQTKEYVAAQESARARSDGAAASFRESRQILCTTSAIPCKQPKNTYVHPAPCHKPARNIVMNRFT